MGYVLLSLWPRLGAGHTPSVGRAIIFSCVAHGFRPLGAL